MTNEEKQIMKNLCGIVCEMTVKQAALLTIVRLHVEDWPSKVASVISSPEHRNIQKDSQKLRQTLELLTCKDIEVLDGRWRVAHTCAAKMTWVSGCRRQAAPVCVENVGCRR
jgi:hypothetical protein